MAECSGVLPAVVAANSWSKTPKEISQRQTRVSETRTRYEPHHRPDFEREAPDAVRSWVAQDFRRDGVSPDGTQGSLGRNAAIRAAVRGCSDGTCRPAARREEALRRLIHRADGRHRPGERTDPRRPRPRRPLRARRRAGLTVAGPRVRPR